MSKRRHDVDLWLYRSSNIYVWMIHAYNILHFSAVLGSIFMSYSYEALNNHTQEKYLGTTQVCSPLFDLLIFEM